MEVSEMDEDALQRFLRSGSRRTRGRHGDVAALNRLLVLLRQLKAVPSKLHPAPVSSRERVTAEFSRYLLQERGLSQATLLTYVPLVDRFLNEQFKNGRVNLSRLRAADVTAFVQRQARQLNSVRAKSLVIALRSFFRHLQHRGEISTDLAACVPSVRYWSFSDVTLHY